MDPVDPASNTPQDARLTAVNSDTVLSFEFAQQPVLVNTMMTKGRKRTQRERLLRGMVDVANRGGYAGANVSAVIEKAGVSRPDVLRLLRRPRRVLRGGIADVQEEPPGSVTLASRQHRQTRAAMRIETHLSRSRHGAARVRVS